MVNLLPSKSCNTKLYAPDSIQHNSLNWLFLATACGETGAKATVEATIQLAINEGKKIFMVQLYFGADGDESSMLNGCSSRGDA